MKKCKILMALLLAAALAGCTEETVAETVTERTVPEMTEAAVSEVSEVSSSTTAEETTAETVTEKTSDIPEKLIKFEDGEYYGYKDGDGNIVIPAEHYIRNYFKNEDMTGEAVEVENALYYIYKDGTVFLKMDYAPVVYSDFYNGFAFYDGRFIDEQGNTVHESINTRSIDRIRYWGNGYFENYSFAKPSHASFVAANGNEKIRTCNVSVSQLVDGYAVVDRGCWSVLINSDLEVKAIFLNTIECMPNYKFIGLFYDYIEDKNFLKIRKGYKSVTEPYDFNEIDEIKGIFGDDCNLENVSVYIYDSGETEIDLENWGLNDDYEYDFVDLLDITNKDKL